MYFLFAKYESNSLNFKLYIYILYLHAVILLSMGGTSGLFGGVLYFMFDLRVI